MKDTLIGMKDTLIPISVRPYEEDDFAPVHRLEMTKCHEPYRSEVFIRQIGIVCHNTFLVATLDTEKIGYVIGSLVQGDPTKLVS